MSTRGRRAPPTHEPTHPRTKTVQLSRTACTVAQDGQAAGSEALKGGARPARVRGPFMAFVYRFFRTFCNHVRAASCDVLVRQLGVWKRMWQVDSDIL